jgi:hypothetical protein
MSEQYRHTLISLDKSDVPQPAAVRAFLSEMIDKRVVPGSPEVLLRTWTGKMREYPNPFIGGIVKIEQLDRKPLANLDEFERATAKLPDYQIAVYGEGRPKLPPLQMKSKGPYFVAVTCYICSKLRSTSDSHEETLTGRRAAFYGDPFKSSDMTGFFCDPESGEIIEVPEAGAARFWIEFELGKFLFPNIVDGNLDLLNAEIVADAERHFGVEFVQGCSWG